VLDKLYGKERDLILSINGLSDADAMNLLQNRYGGEVSEYHGEAMLMISEPGIYEGEIKNLLNTGHFREDFLIDGVYCIQLTSKCRNYSQIETDYDARTKPSQSVTAISSTVIMAGRDVLNASQNLNVRQDVNDILDLLSQMRVALRQEAGICSDVKGEIMDDLDIIEEQCQSPTPNKVRLGKAWKNISEVVRTSASLLAIFNTLQPLIQELS